VWAGFDRVETSGGSCEHDSGLCDFIIGENCLDQPRKNSAPFS
jgi:hypothetical protein